MVWGFEVVGEEVQELQECPLGAAVVQLESVHRAFGRQRGAHICPWLVPFGTSFTSFAGSNGGSEPRGTKSARGQWMLIKILCFLPLCWLGQ